MIVGRIAVRAAIRDLADFLAEAGSVVGGGAALFGALAFLAGQAARDLGSQSADPLKWAERGAQWGAVAGVVALIYRLAGVD